MQLGVCVFLCVLGSEWISTGLYLSPGMKTYMSFPAQIVNKGWHVCTACVATLASLKTKEATVFTLHRRPTVGKSCLLDGPYRCANIILHNLHSFAYYLIYPLIDINIIPTGCLAAPRAVYLFYLLQPR